MLTAIKNFFKGSPAVELELGDAPFLEIAEAPLLAAAPVYIEPVVEPEAPTPSAKPTHRFEVYADAEDKHRWRLVAIQNGQTVATSGESFLTKLKAQRAVKRLASLFTVQPLIVTK